MARGPAIVPLQVPARHELLAGRGAPLGGLVLRLRAPTGWKMASAALSDGGAWAVDARAECVRFSQAQLRAAGTLAKVQGITVKYTKLL